MSGMKGESWVNRCVHGMKGESCLGRCVSGVKGERVGWTGVCMV